MDAFVTDGAFGYFLDRRWCPSAKGLEGSKLTKHYHNDDGSEMTEAEAKELAGEGAQVSVLLLFSFDCMSEYFTILMTFL